MYGHVYDFVTIPSQGNLNVRRGIWGNYVPPVNYENLTEEDGEDV
jgi:hypothetical protein